MFKNWQAAFSRVRAALMHRGRTEQDADDLVQEAWIRLACYQRDRPVARPEAFLMRAALNLSIDAHRAQANRGQAVALDDVVLIDATPSAEDVLLARERVGRLSLGLAHLSDKTRAIFLAHRIDGMSYQQIAQRHRVSVSAVEKQIAKATMLLARWMEGW